MLQMGFLEEMQTLRTRGDLSPELPSMRCVGYRQAWEQMDALQSQGLSEKTMLERLQETAVAATRQLAKRQLTWLRGMPERHIVECDNVNSTTQALTLAKQLIAKAP